MKRARRYTKKVIMSTTHRGRSAVIAALATALGLAAFLTLPASMASGQADVLTAPAASAITAPYADPGNPALDKAQRAASAHAAIAQDDSAQAAVAEHEHAFHLQHVAHLLVQASLAERAVTRQAPPASTGAVTVTAAVATTATTTAAARSGTAARALAWALTQAGKWYAWGGAGPSTYDCSGLVMRAYQHAGITLPHNTGMMVRSGKLVRTSSPRPGDLVMWGGSSPYHVELYISHGRTFGAHHSGTRIGYASLWGSPAFYRVVA